MRRRRQHFFGWELVLVLFLLSCRLTGVSLPLLARRGGHFGDIALRLFPPDWGYAPRVLPLLWATVQMSVTGTFLGSLLALLAAPFCAGTLPGPRLDKRLCRGIIQVLRAFPALILALLATFLFGLTSFSGAAAITVYTFSIMTRLTYEDLENAPAAPFQALRAMGVSSAKAYFRALVPAVAPSYLTNVLYLLETNVRHSAILGYVGAGGVGLVLNEKVSWREYEKVGAILFLLFLTVCAIEGLSARLTSAILGERKLSRRGRRLLAAAAVILGVLCTVSLQPPDFSHASSALLRNMLAGFAHPAPSLLLSTSSEGVAALLLETACIALAGTGLGTLAAIPLVFLSSARIVPAPLAAAVRTVILAIRSVPFLIYGLIFIRVTGPGSFAGVLTLAVCSLGLLCKRFHQAIDSADFRPVRALEAMGIPPLPRLLRGLIPQLRPAFASAVLYRFDVNLREAAVLGLVGAGGIGAPLIFAMNQYAWSQASALALGLIVLTWAVDTASARLRRRLAQSRSA